MDEAQLIEIKRHLAVILGRQPGDLAGAIAALDALKQTVTGHLAHYLANRSYQKAWTQLEGGQPEKGICGGRHP